MEIITKNAEETFRLGEEIGSSLRGGEILAFEGGMGTGKTTFIQGLAKGLGIKNKIVSPTFILMRTYGHFYHLDLYRLEGNIKNGVRDLGLFDIIKDKNNIVAIEWAEKIREILPESTTWVKFEDMEDDARKIVINYGK